MSTGEIRSNSVADVRPKAWPFPDSALHAASTVLRICLRHQISLQITGGLAAGFYGVVRPIYDLDFTVADDDLTRCAALFTGCSGTEVAPFANRHWEFLQFSCHINGWNIDFAGQTAKLFSVKDDRWIPWHIDLSNPTVVEYQGTAFRLERKEELIRWKRLLLRPADLIDVEQLLALYPDHEGTADASAAIPHVLEDPDAKLFE